MPELSAELKKLLVRAKLVVFPEDYVVVYLPVGVQAIPGEWFRPATTRFAVVIQEPSVITMIVARRKWLRMQGMFDNYEVNGPFKVISFDNKLSPTAAGYMSAIGAILTDEKIKAIPISSFRGDHLIVPKAELPRAVKLLRVFLQSGKKTAPGNAGSKTR
ncbi:MAG TPA: ACT domain-containing protein [Acidobacteriota bacterium]|nr:ACT domain-containing protein [Acidobacteriota bacterium]